MTDKRPDYKNWIPKGMIWGFGAASAALASAAAVTALPAVKMDRKVKAAATAALALGSAGCAALTAWCAYAYGQFSYDGERQLSRQIIEGTADFVQVPEGRTCLDVGCGSGALAIAVAKRNPGASVVGVDKWGPEYASFSQAVCEDNARAEGVTNVSFHSDNACRLDFPDESFDAVTSNYVYHNIAGVNKQLLLKETLRVLKKGGTFAIHDLMGKSRYGDMESFVRQLKDEGYEDVRLIPTADGMFMTKQEGRRIFLADSCLLVGKK